MRLCLPFAFPFAFTIGCDPPQQPNPADTTPPTAVISVLNTSGEYVPATETSMNATSGQLQLICKVEDDGGVSSVKLSFGRRSDGCRSSTGWTVSGKPGFPILGNGIPADLSQTAAGTGTNGKLLATMLPLLATVSGPLTCDMPSAGGAAVVGRPTTMTVTCAGSNFAAAPKARDGTATLKVGFF